MLNKISLITNYNLYESKRHFTLKLSDALNRRGIETRIIDAQESVLNSNTINAIKKFNPDLTLSFNTLLPISEDRFLWDFLETPHLAVLVDPALYSMNLLRSPYTILSSIDRSDVRQLKTEAFSNVFFWPHAVEKTLTFDPKMERPFDVVFLGSCYDYESLRASWRQRNPESINKVLDDAIDLFFSDKRATLASTLVSAWNRSGMDPAGVDFTALFYYLDNYTRGKDRVDLIRSIKDAHVHVYGDLSNDNAVGILGWSQYLAKQPNVTVHTSVPFAEALNVVRRSKICLNSAPFFKDGSHERVLVSLACGAVPVTNENLYFEEFFKDGQEVIFYALNKKEAVNDRINALLQNESQRQTMAEKGRAIVMRDHTWDVRVDQLMTALPEILTRIETTHAQ